MSLRRLSAATFGLVVALGAVEFGVRLLAPQPVGYGGPLNRGQLTTPGDHRVTTDEFDVTVHVNAAGFVDTEWPDRTTPPTASGGGVAGGAIAPPAPRGATAHRPEVVVIGDSFVQAAQVAPGQGFGAQVESELHAHGYDVDVISMGVPGAGTATELGVLREYALPRQPALVVLGFLVANDVLNNHPLLEGKDDKPFYELREGKLTPVDAAGLVTDSPLWRWSHAWRWATRAWTVRAVTERKLALGEGMPLDLRVHDPACVRGGGTEPRCAVWDEAWVVTEALIAEMARECKAAGVKFQVVLFPDRVQVERKSEWPGAKGWSFEAAEVRAAAIAGSSAPVLDLLPTLRGAGGDLYFPKDGHWTARGHAIAARTTAPYVAAKLDE